MASPWNLMRSGAIDEGLRQLRDAFAKQSDASHAMELGVACLWLKDYLAALEHFHYMQETHIHRLDCFRTMAGTAKWCLGLPQEAVAEWHAGLKAHYNEGAGGVTCPLLLYFASIVAPNAFSRAEAERLLGVRADDSWARNWPGALAKFAVGRIDEEQLDRECIAPSEGQSLMRHWLAGFYLGLEEFDRGEIGLYKEFMRKTGTASDDDFDVSKRYFLAKLWHPEFFLARYEGRT